jgi:hypothetical protein
MNEECEEGGAHHDPCRPGADGRKDPVDDRVQHSRIGHNTEEQNGENEHAYDRRQALDAGDHKFTGVPAESAD